MNAPVVTPLAIEEALTGIPPPPPDSPTSTISSSTLSANSNTGRWTSKEHAQFLEALRRHGQDWRKIALDIKTRNNVQTHAQKYFKKLERMKRKLAMRANKQATRDEVANKAVVRSSDLKRGEDVRPTKQVRLTIHEDESDGDEKKIKPSVTPLPTSITNSASGLFLPLPVLGAPGTNQHQAQRVGLSLAAASATSANRAFLSQQLLLPLSQGLLNPPQLLQQGPRPPLTLPQLPLNIPLAPLNCGPVLTPSLHNRPSSWPFAGLNMPPAVPPSVAGAPFPFLAIPQHSLQGFNPHQARASGGM